MKQLIVKFAKKSGALALLALLLMAGAAPAAAQKNKDKKKDQPKTDSAANPGSFLPAPDSQVIDRTIGEAIGYWQIGDTDSLHKYYADDVVVVSGAWEPPVMGWDNYVRAYQEQRARVTGSRMDRTNTLIKVNGNSAWATYQFTYSAMLEGKVVTFHGHTTLILNKQGDRWLIALNHSSIIPDTAFQSAAPPASSTPAHQP
jgi:ketosteroid isomerase-like protein